MIRLGVDVGKTKLFRKETIAPETKPAANLSHCTRIKTAFCKGVKSGPSETAREREMLHRDLNFFGKMFSGELSAPQSDP